MNHFKLYILILVSLIFFGCQQKSKGDPIKEENWIQLFNGINLNDWIVKINGYPINMNINNTFRVEDSILKVSYDSYDTFGDSYGHIFYKRPFSSYKLKLEYRFVGKQVKDGQDWAKKNSGVMIHSQSPESMQLNQSFPISLEVQLLGGLREGEKRSTGNLCTPGTHVTIDEKLITEHCINSSSKTFYGEEWIDLEILVLKDSIISHKINDNEVISYTKPILGGDYFIDNKEWKPKEGKALKEGYIALQSESHPIEFKNIELLELNDFN